MILVNTSILLAGLLSLSCLLSSCAVTTAPTESSTETLGKTSHASAELTSSTSPGSSVDKSAALEDFTRVHFASIKSEAAAGQGEHLAALGALAGVPAAQSPHFCSLAQKRYAVLFAATDTTPKEMLSALQHTLATEPVFLR